MLENLVEAQMGDHLDALASCALWPPASCWLLLISPRRVRKPKRIDGMVDGWM